MKVGQLHLLTPAFHDPRPCFCSFSSHCATLHSLNLSEPKMRLANQSPSSLFIAFQACRGGIGWSVNQNTVCGKGQPGGASTIDFPRMGDVNILPPHSF